MEAQAEGFLQRTQTGCHAYGLVHIGQLASGTVEQTERDGLALVGDNSLAGAIFNDDLF